MGILSFLDVCKASEGYIRPTVEGEQIYKSNMLITVGMKSSDGRGKVEVVSLCPQTSKLDGPPHEINVTIDVRKHEGERILSSHCSCKAGASEKCKHLIGTLMFLQWTETEELDDLSCTDLAQQWGKLKANTKEMFKPAPVATFCHFPLSQQVYARKNEVITSDLLSEFQQLLISVDPRSEGHIFFSGQRAANRSDIQDGGDLQAKIITEELFLNNSPLPEMKEINELSESLLSQCSKECQDFYRNSVCLSEREAVDLAVNTINQCDSTWFDERGKRSTASKGYGLFTYSRNKKPDWVKKLASTFHSSFQGNTATCHGIRYEADAREAYVRDTACDVVTTGFLVHPLVPWLGFSPDGIVCQSGCPAWLIEIKCPLEGKKYSEENLLPYVNFIDKKTGRLKINHMYSGQVQIGQFVTGLPRCDFVIYASCDDSFIFETIMFNKERTMLMIRTLASVYFSIVLPWLVAESKLPPIVGSDDD